MVLLSQNLENIDLDNPNELKKLQKLVFKQRMIALKLKGLTVPDAKNELKRDLQDFIEIFAGEYRNDLEINNTNLERFINVNMKLREDLLNLRKSMKVKNMGSCRQELEKILERNFGVKLR